VPGTLRSPSKTGLVGDANVLWLIERHPANTRHDCHGRLAGQSHHGTAAVRSVIRLFAPNCPTWRPGNCPRF
jgi:hypothetical protein